MSSVRSAHAGSTEKELRRFLNPRDNHWYVQIMQGDSYVTADAREILTTILGSCIAACIRDPEAGIGGMNHFLLPEGSGEDRNAQRFGVNAMEVLINGILKRGGERKRLQAKLFGGANVLAGISDVGSRNATFAKKFLQDEGIQLIGGDLGGLLPRRVQYWPMLGRARQLAVKVDAKALLQREREEAAAEAQPTEDVELF